MPRRSRAETVTAPALSDRPNTSGGLTSANHPEKPDFNKRVSRDDLALILKQSDRNNVRAYHVPIRGRLPSPDHSLRGPSPHRGIMVRTATPDSMPDKTETGVIAIGMALGSPSQGLSSDSAQAAWTVQRAMTATAEEEAQQGQQKTKKWGLFRSKSKRNKQAEQNLTQRSLTETNISTSSVHTRGQPAGSYSRTGSHKHTPIVIRSQTDPSSERLELREPIPEMKLPKETKPAKESKSGGLGRKVSLRALRGDRSRRAIDKELPIPAMPSPPPPSLVPQSTPQLPGPLLDVEIPSIKMERYSVMFGGVLGGQSSSSLLARRQATLDRLKTINGDIHEDEELTRPRRATSPQPTASPSFNLFPAPQRHQLASQRSPRLRSNTSPAMLPSPVQPTFQKEAMPSKEQVGPETLQPKVFQPAPLRIVKKNPVGTSETTSKSNKQAKRAAAAQAENTNKLETLRRQTTRTPSPARSLDIRSNPPKRHPSPFTPDTSSLVLDSDDEDGVDSHITEKLRPKIEEPKWQMISPPVSTTSSSPGRNRKPSLTSSEKIAMTKTKKPSYDEEALRHAVEISIARQISVSHQQRQMLHPLKSNPSIRRKNEGGPQYAIAIEKDERLAETKTATPRLVRPEDISKWEMHRKSSRVVLEGEP